jgi:VWFA-related protein
MAFRLIAFVLAVAALLGQTQSGEPPVFRGTTPRMYKVTARLVEVNVIVKDKNGLVANLTKDDFVLYDNGKQQKIDVFEVYSRRARLRNAEQAATPRAPNEFTNRPAWTGEQSTAVLVVWDMLNTDFADQPWAKEQVLKSLSAIRPGDHVGVYILGWSLQALQPFTSDSSQLIAAMEKYAARPGDWPRDPGARLVLTATALWEIEGHLANVPARKSVIWIATAPPQILECANFAVYPVDARGLVGFPKTQAGNRVVPRRGPTSPPASETMKGIAARTGGLAFFNANGLHQAIDKALTDDDVTYTLGFYVDSDQVLSEGQAQRPPPPKPGERFVYPTRTLKVEVKRKGVQLSYRNGYWPIRLIWPEQSKELIADAAASAIESSQIGINARVERDGTALRLALTIEAADISLADNNGRRTGAVDLTVLARTANGGELARVERAVDLDFDQAGYEAFLKRNIQMPLTVQAKPGVAEVKIVAFDRTSGRIGSLAVPIEP